LTAPGDLQSSTCRIFPATLEPETDDDELDGCIFELISVESGSALDLSEEDIKTVVGRTLHRGNHQRWKFLKFGHGYLIQSTSSKKFLTIEDDIKEETQVVATFFPVSWEVEIVDPEKKVIKIIWPNEKFALDLVSRVHHSTRKSLVNLMWSAEGEECQLWRLNRCHFEEPPTRDSSKANAPAVDVVINAGTEDGVHIDSKTTTTITTVTTITKHNSTSSALTPSGSKVVQAGSTSLELQHL